MEAKPPERPKVCSTFVASVCGWLVGQLISVWSFAFDAAVFNVRAASWSAVITFGLTLSCAYFMARRRWSQYGVQLKEYYERSNAEKAAMFGILYANPPCN